MKRFLLICALFATALACNAEEPLPGIYRGYITITRSNKALRLNDVVTLTVVGEIYSTSPGFAHLAWTATNFDQSSRLDNQWADFMLDYTALQQKIPDIQLAGSLQPSLSGGNTVPGSLKMTSKSLAWKCIKEGNSPYPRNITITTVFSITRTGQSPPPDPNP